MRVHIKTALRYDQPAKTTVPEGKSNDIKESSKVTAPGGSWWAVNCTQLESISEETIHILWQGRTVRSEMNK